MIVWSQHGGQGSAALRRGRSVEVRRAQGKTVEVGKTAVNEKVARKAMERQEIYQITDRTRIKGDVAAGTQFMVRYREEQGVRIATDIEVQGVNKLW